MKKLLLLPIVLLLVFSACKKKTPTNPEPEEFFSFYADGEYFYYPQVKKSSLGGGPIVYLEANASNSTLGYRIHARSDVNPVAAGAFAFYLPGGSIPDQDTMIIGNSLPRVEILHFKKFAHYYYTVIPNAGKLIFTERTVDRVSGTFYFQAQSDSAGTVNITDGKFSIKTFKR